MHNERKLFSIVVNNHIYLTEKLEDNRYDVQHVDGDGKHIGTIERPKTDHGVIVRDKQRLYCYFETGCTISANDQPLILKRVKQHESHLE